jgi:hypothetical protein
MKKRNASVGSGRTKQVVCTVSAAALMLGVSEAATVGLHFQEHYCNYADYSGFVVSLMAFGIAPDNWQNLTPMETGYSTCDPLQLYNLSEVIDTTTSTNGLNPLPNGSLTVAWSANGANFSGFAGYGGKAPSYAYDGPPPTSIPTGEWQIYSTFLRDGVNFGVGSSCGDNSQPAYTVDITGLKSVFTNSPFVIQLIAAADSMQTLTNAFIIDVTGAKTNSVIYPSTPMPYDEHGTCGQWLRGHGGGLSTASGTLNADHIEITSNHPQHGGTGTPPNGFDEAGTISGFIVTDKPLVTMAAQPVLAGQHDQITLNPCAIGVPPLAYQWRLNGIPVPGATNLTCVIANLTAGTAGNYDLVVTNLYGSTTSTVTTITDDKLTMTTTNGLVADTNPSNPQRNGVDLGATWLASSSDGTTTRSGIMQFVAANTNQIVVQGSTNFNPATGTITFWMRSAGTDSSIGGGVGAALFDQTTNSAQYAGNDFIIIQEDGGNLFFNAPNGTLSVNSFTSSTTISDNKWHLVALTFDQSASGSATLYVDGVLDTTSPNDNAWGLPVGSPIQIGATSDSTYRPYNGLLDDVRFYSRELTGTEIVSIYNSDSLVDTTNLQMRLNFDAAPGVGYGLSWMLGGVVLQSATSAAGPYTDVIGATSPYNLTTTQGLRFYRYRFTNQSWISNPFQM